MKIDCLSDTHGIVNISKLEFSDADVLIIAGDISDHRMKKSKIEDILNEIKKCPHKYKILIAGNHDNFLFDKNMDINFKDYGITYLENEYLFIDGIKFFGSPYTQKFCGWWFMHTEEELLNMWDDLLEDDIDVLVTHGPAKVLDKNYNGESCGSLSLQKMIEKYKPKYHIFGHIHEDNGQYFNEITMSYNVSILDGNYEQSNPVTEIDI